MYPCTFENEALPPDISQRFEWQSRRGKNNSLNVINICSFIQLFIIIMKMPIIWMSWDFANARAKRQFNDFGFDFFFRCCCCLVRWYFQTETWQSLEAGHRNKQINCFSSVILIKAKCYFHLLPTKLHRLRSSSQHCTLGVCTLHWCNLL